MERARVEAERVARVESLRAEAERAAAIVVATAVRRYTACKGPREEARRMRGIVERLEEEHRRERRRIIEVARREREGKKKIAEVREAERGGGSKGAEARTNAAKNNTPKRLRHSTNTFYVPINTLFFPYAAVGSEHPPSSQRRRDLAPGRNQGPRPRPLRRGNGHPDLLAWRVGEAAVSGQGGNFDLSRTPARAESRSETP